MNKEDILIVCALEQETNNELDDWNIIYTGCGKVNATYELTKEINSVFIPKLVINFGTAGSKDIPIHTLVDCTKFIQRDMDKTALGFVRGETAFETNIPMMLDFSYVDSPIGKNYVCGTGDNFVQDISKEIEHIDVFDMESYAIAKTCWKNGIDFISYKYITDNVNEKSVNDWLENCSKGIEEFKKILKYYDNN